MILSGTVVAGVISALAGGGTTEGIRWARGRRTDRAGADYSLAQTVTTLGERLDKAETRLDKYRAAQALADEEREKDRAEQRRITGLLHEAIGVLRDFLDLARAQNLDVPDMSDELKSEIDTRGVTDADSDRG